MNEQNLFVGKELDALFFDRSEEIVEKLKSADLSKDEIIDVLGKRYNKALDLIEKLERNQALDNYPMPYLIKPSSKGLDYTALDLTLGDCRRLFPTASDVKLEFKVPQATIDNFSNMVKTYAKNTAITSVIKMNDNEGKEIDIETATFSSVRTPFGEIKLIKDEQ